MLRMSDYYEIKISELKDIIEQWENDSGKIEQENIKLKKAFQSAKEAFLVYDRVGVMGARAKNWLNEFCHD